MTRGLRDFLFLFAALAAAVIAGAIARQFFDPRWEAAIGVGFLFAASAIVKVVRPLHVFLARLSWLYLVLVFAIVEAMVILLSDYTIVGYWTYFTAICLGLLVCVVHVAFGPRRG